MALPNNDPIYTRVADVQATTLTGNLGPTANTAQDGTGTIYPIWTADATNGGFLQKLSLQSISTTALTVMRVFICNTVPTVTSGALVSNTAANTWLLTELTLPAVTVSQTSGNIHLELPINLALPPSFRICVAFGTSTGASTTGWSVLGIGGKY